jgi:aryl-alcohol dehydrogenase-like predicted oxidoreductase
MNDKGFAVIDRLDEIAKSRNATISQVALAWLLGNSAVHSVIIGPRTLEQLTDNMGGATFELSEAEHNSLSELTAWK